MNVLPTNAELMDEDGEDGAAGRIRMPFTGCQSDDFVDCDDLPNEDDLLTEVIPEERRLQRLLEIQSPFEKDAEGTEPYMSSCRLLAKSVHVPISWVSLVYDEFQWFKANVGLETNQTERCWSFCAHTFSPKNPEVLYVPDALEDERFRDNLLVHHSPNIRFYCGVPLVTQDGVRLGALCIIDTKPRVMSKCAFQFLINLAELTVREMLQKEIGHTYKPSCPPLPAVSLNPGTKIRRIPTATRMRRLREQWFEKGLTEGVLIIDRETPEWDVVWTNSQWNAWTKNANITTSQYIWSVLRPAKGEPGTEMQRRISEKLERSPMGSCSFLARVVGVGGKSSIFVSCEAVVATRPIKDVKYHIRMPSDNITARPGTDPIVLDGGKFVMVFVKHAQEGLAATKTSSFSDDDPAQCSVQSGCLLPASLFEPQNTSMTKTGAGQGGSEYGTPAAHPAGTSLKNPVASDKASVKKETVVPAIARDQKSAATHASGILKIFQSFDKENTGQIRKELLVTLVKKILFEYNENFQHDMIEQLVDSCGFDRDGFITYNDFVAVLFDQKVPDAL